MKLVSFRASRWLVAAALLVSSMAGQAAQEFVQCPAWSTARSSYISSAVEAAKAYYENSLTISEATPACTPFMGVTCTPSASAQTQFNCQAYRQPSCSQIPWTTTASGSGVPGANDGITTGTNPADSRTWCARFVPAGYEPGKNNGGGDDDCPDCKKNFKGNPVNIGTGNKFQTEADFSSAGEGKLEFTRYYNSDVPLMERGLGRGWTHTWTRSLVAMGSSTMIGYRPDGKYFKYRLVSGSWTADADVPYTLVPDGSGWKLLTARNETELYSSAGRLTAVISPQGRVTTFEYSDGTASGPLGGVTEGSTNPLPVGLLLRAIEHTGRSMEFFYNARANIVRMTVAGQTYLFGYDANFALATVTYPGSQVRTYHYNESANTSGANLLAALTGITDENSARFATYKYNTSRQAISTEHAGGVDKYQFAYGASTTTTDPLGTTLTSPISEILGVKQATGTTRTCSGCTSTTESTTYDANRYPTSEKGFNGNLTCFTYGARRLEIVRTEGLSGTGTCASRATTSATRTITTDWHSTWRIKRRIAEPLRITTFAFNGDPSVSCAPAGASTTLVCSKTVQATTDTDGSLAFSATSDGAARVWGWTYNLEGQVLTADGPRTDVTDQTSLTYYTSDDVGGKYRKGDLATSTNALSHVNQFTEYDSAGRLLKSIDPNGLETILEYWRADGSRPARPARPRQAMRSLRSTTIPRASSRRSRNPTRVLSSTPTTRRTASPISRTASATASITRWTTWVTALRKSHTIPEIRSRGPTAA